MNKRGETRRPVIVGIFIITTIILALAISIYLNQSLRRTVYSNWIDHHHTSSNLVVAYIEDQITDATKKLQFVASLPELQSLPNVHDIDMELRGIPLGVDQQKRELFDSLLEYNPVFNVIFLLTPEGDHYISHPYEVQKNLQRFNLADREYFQEAVRTKELVVSDSFIGADGETAIAINIPILNEESQIIAHLGGVIHVKNVSAEIVAISATGERIISILLDRNHGVIGESGIDELNYSEYDLESIIAILTDEKDSTDVQQRSKQTVINEGGYIAVYTELNTGWSFASVIAIHDLEAEIFNQIKRVLIVVIIMILVISAVGMVFINRVVRKWHAAEEALKRSHQLLEQRVEERTADIQKVNQELLKKNVELEQFVYITSHDLRSPLVNMQGFSKELSLSFAELKELLDKSTIEDEVREQAALYIEEDIPEALQYINASTEKMDALLSGLLQLSRAGSGTMSREKIDMNQLMRSVLETVEYRLNSLDIECVLEGLPEAYGDPKKINQVFTNLIDNAIKYKDEVRKGKIRVYGYIEDEKAIFCVEDNGIGILPEHQEKVFTIFYQLQPKHKMGEGLGLSIVKKIVQHNNGEIWLTSEFGKGSSFFVSLDKA